MNEIQLGWMLVGALIEVQFAITWWVIRRHFCQQKVDDWDGSMPTVESTQEVVDEVKKVCDKYGVVLIGACYSEGIPGEIEIVDATKVKDADIGRLTNRAESLNGHAIYVSGIGTPSSTSLGDEHPR